MKRLYARLFCWLAFRKSKCRQQTQTGNLQFFASEVSGIDPTTDRVMWRITKDGFRVVTPDVTQPSEGRSDRRAAL